MPDFYAGFHNLKAPLCFDVGILNVHNDGLGWKLKLKKENL